MQTNHTNTERIGTTFKRITNVIPHKSDEQSQRLRKDFYRRSTSRRAHHLPIAPFGIRYDGDEKGELLLRFLCDPDLCNQLDELLASDLCPADYHYLVENDAMTEDGIPVLFAYTCNLYRIKKFNSGLVKHEINGIIYCFEYQAEVLRECCSDSVEFQTLSYEKG